MRRGPGKRTQILRAAILEWLARDDEPVSSRQVFYGLISNGTIANCKSDLGTVQEQLVKMRREGLIPYPRIIDRSRAMYIRPSWAGLSDLLEAAAAQYRRTLWNSLSVVPMIGLEKEALEGVVATEADPFSVAVWPVKGQSSEHMVWTWANLIKEHNEAGKHVAITYFGDHDPSGYAIEHNLQERLTGFGASYSWVRGGLFAEDFDAFDLVKLPLKMKDPNAKRFRSRFASYGAELDALPPDELRRRVRDAITQHVDADIWAQVQATEETERESLRLVTGHWDAALAGARGAA